MEDNAKVLEDAKKKINSVIGSYMLDRITEIAIKLLHDGVVSAQYHNVTGNTLTSLAVGIYYRGGLSRIITAVVTQGLKNATRPKLSRGDGLGVIMVRSYENGRLIPIKKYNLIDTNGEYGLTTSVNFLKNYRSPRDVIGLVMCTGTEYSNYLESKKGLNVLSDTYDYAESIAKMTFKPM